MFSTRSIEGGLGLIPLPWIREINDFQVFYWPQQMQSPPPSPRQISENAPEFFAGNSLFLYCIFETTVILLRNYSEIFRIHTFFTLTFQNSDIFYFNFSEFRHFSLWLFRIPTFFYFNLSEFQHFSLWLFRIPTFFYFNFSEFQHFLF